MNPMFREGDIAVRLSVNDGQIRSVRIASTRASLPPRLTQGRPAEQVASTLPLLFSICARAQGAAAAGALDAACGVPPEPSVLHRRSGEVQREATVELLSRLLIYWPRVMDAAPEVSAVARARQAMPAQAFETCRDIARERIYASDPARWLDDPTLDTLDRWSADASTLPARLLGRLRREAPGLGRSDIRPMPETGSEAICAMLPSFDADPAFCRTPDWHGLPVEAGALARRARHPLVAAFIAREGNSVAARFVAQLVDLAAMLTARAEAPVVRQYAVGPGIGIGLAETARGLLLHQAKVGSDERVERYRVIAPTEWNFHPAGALTQGLLKRSVADSAAARRDATLLAQALDPCVAFAVEVADA
jgi:hypothetical protein